MVADRRCFLHPVPSPSQTKTGVAYHISLPHHLNTQNRRPPFGFRYCTRFFTCVPSVSSRGLVRDPSPDMSHPPSLSAEWKQSKDLWASAIWGRQSEPQEKKLPAFHDRQEANRPAHSRLMNPLPRPLSFHFLRQRVSLHMPMLDLALHHGLEIDDNVAW
ncbi:hypothetical protein M440DRAFT_364888 [Trichoderma longibrachiatum ATCC 18648]|uniref:Uncharacterized protein n=1 Tax=Trichoderma longibrachiatum ATCC 18648 TaxID=983965 RepID=A0A2T4BWW4_TRILO|nr:hypothetical protein M440DRAFT_364888 [Trichoderma longibrachiatum ATCC 18648]